jgi:hypothetical protein
MITPKELNEINHRFWADQRALLERRMVDHVLRQTAFELMDGELRRQVPVKSQLSMYQAFADADKMRRQFLAAQGRAGGKAPKSDALQLLIERIVERRPSITCQELERQLEVRSGIDPIVEFDGAIICFTKRDGGLKEAPLTGLKDRLSRARAKIRSR